MTTKKKPQRTKKPASDPESREKQLIQLAVDLAEKQLIDGSAPPSVINHFLKLASKRETLERDILEKQAELITAKSQGIKGNKDAEKLAKEAIEAMKSYTQSGG